MVAPSSLSERREEASVSIQRRQDERGLSVFEYQSQNSIQYLSLTPIFNDINC